MAKRAHNVDPKLLEVLVAPGSHAPLELSADGNELISRRDNLAFPIRDGIPIMLASEARPLDDHPNLPFERPAEDEQ